MTASTKTLESSSAKGASTVRLKARMPPKAESGSVSRAFR